MTNLKSLNKQWGELESTTVSEIYVSDISFDTENEEWVREVVASMSDEKEFTITVQPQIEQNEIINWYYVIKCSNGYIKTYEIDSITTGSGIVADVLYLIGRYYRNNA